MFSSPYDNNSFDPSQFHNFRRKFTPGSPNCFAFVGFEQTHRSDNPRIGDPGDLQPLRFVRSSYQNGQTSWVTMKMWGFIKPSLSKINISTTGQSPYWLESLCLFPQIWFFSPIFYHKPTDVFDASHFWLIKIYLRSPRCVRITWNPVLFWDGEIAGWNHVKSANHIRYLDMVIHHNLALLQGTIKHKKIQFFQIWWTSQWKEMYHIFDSNPHLSWEENGYLNTIDINIYKPHILWHYGY